MRLPLALVSMIAIFMTSSCGNVPHDQTFHQPKFDIEIPKDEFPVDQVKGFLEDLFQLTETSKTRLAFTDLVKMARLSDKFQGLAAEIGANREEWVEIECQGLKCVGTSLGKKMSFKIDQVSIPILGNPNVLLNEMIKVTYQLTSDAKIAEVCRIEGIDIQTVLFKAPLDGSIIELAEDGTVKNAKIDVAAGGSYPSTQCDF